MSPLCRGRGSRGWRLSRPFDQFTLPDHKHTCPVLRHISFSSLNQFYKRQPITPRSARDLLDYNKTDWMKELSMIVGRTTAKIGFVFYKATTVKFKFTPLPKDRGFCQKKWVFSSKNAHKTTKTSFFPFDCFPFSNDFFPTGKPISSTVH